MPSVPAAPATCRVPLLFSAAVADYEKSLLRTALAENNQHQGNTAEALGLSYDQLRGLLRKYELTPKRRGRSAA